MPLLFQIGGFGIMTAATLLGVMVWSEIRGARDAHLFGWRIGTHVERQTLTVVILAMALTGLASLHLLDHELGLE